MLANPTQSIFVILPLVCNYFLMRVFLFPVRNIHYRGCFKLPKSTISKFPIYSFQPNLTTQSCIETCTDKVWISPLKITQRMMNLLHTAVCTPVVFSTPRRSDVGAQSSSDFAEYLRFIVPLMRSRWSGSCTEVFAPKTEIAGRNIAHHLVVTVLWLILTVCVCACVYIS